MSKNDNFFSPETLEEQENLSLERLATFVPPQLNTEVRASRPSANFIDLMDWTVFSFGSELSSTKDLQKFVHNRIIIDGQFIQFCKENKVSVKCLYKDSVISWKTDNNYEKFFVQGIFLIKAKGVEFLHAALFHKGNQQEDEISFFVVCDNSHYNQYIELRNKFDEWVQQRDRSNLYIRVLEAEDISYTKDHSWEDLFLPQDIKVEIKNLVENFLASKDFYAKNKIPWKRGVLLHGFAGNGKSSIIRTIISNYNFKPVTIVPEANNELIRAAFNYAEEQSPSLLFFEDLDTMLDRNIDTSSFLNLMDGISAKNGLLVIATANEIKKLKPSIIDRPSRFDRKYEIPLPDYQMSMIYLKKWFGSLITADKYKELCKTTVKFNFSYAYLKELYVSAMFEALSNNRKNPTDKDIQTSLNRLIKDKQMLKNGSINLDKYYQA